MTPASQAIEQLEKLLGAATDGEWESGIDFSHFNASELRKPDGFFYVGLNGADAAFIAAIHNAAPGLIACAKALDVLVAPDAAYFDGDVRLTFASHAEAVRVVREARAALNLLAGEK